MSTKAERPREPVFFPPPPGVDPAEGERVYARYLSLLQLEAHVVLAVADLVADDRATRRLRDTGHLERVLWLTAAVDNRRGLLPDGCVDGAGNWVKLPPWSEHAVEAKRVFVEDFALEIVGIVERDEVLADLLGQTRLLGRLCHVRMAVEFARRDASGVYAECLGAPRHLRRDEVGQA